jgi:hypothetical protein
VDLWGVLYPAAIRENIFATALYFPSIPYPPEQTDDVLPARIIDYFTTVARGNPAI